MSTESLNKPVLPNGADSKSVDANTITEDAKETAAAGESNEAKSSPSVVPFDAKETKDVNIVKGEEVVEEDHGGAKTSLPELSPSTKGSAGDGESKKRPSPKAVEASVSKKKVKTDDGKKAAGQHCVRCCSDFLTGDGTRCLAEHADGHRCYCSNCRGDGTPCDRQGCGKCRDDEEEWDDDGCEGDWGGDHEVNPENLGDYFDGEVPDCATCVAAWKAHGLCDDDDDDEEGEEEE